MMIWIHFKGGNFFVFEWKLLHTINACMLYPSMIFCFFIFLAANLTHCCCLFRFPVQFNSIQHRTAPTLELLPFLRIPYIHFASTWHSIHPLCMCSMSLCALVPYAACIEEVMSKSSSLLAGCMRLLRKTFWQFMRPLKGDASHYAVEPLTAAFRITHLLSHSAFHLISLLTSTISFLPIANSRGVLQDCR